MFPFTASFPHGCSKYYVCGLFPLTKITFFKTIWFLLPCKLERINKKLVKAYFNGNEMRLLLMSWNSPGSNCLMLVDAFRVLSPALGQFALVLATRRARVAWQYDELAGYSYSASRRLLCGWVDLAELIQQSFVAGVAFGVVVAPDAMSMVYHPAPFSPVMVAAYLMRLCSDYLRMWMQSWKNKSMLIQRFESLSIRLRSFLLPGLAKCLNSRWRRRLRDCRMVAPHTGHEAGCSDWDRDFGSVCLDDKRHISEFYFHRRYRVHNKCEGPTIWVACYFWSFRFRMKVIRSISFGCAVRIVWCRC